MEELGSELVVMIMERLDTKSFMRVRIAGKRYQVLADTHWKLSEKWLEVYKRYRPPISFDGTRATVKNLKFHMWRWILRKTSNETKCITKSYTKCKTHINTRAGSRYMLKRKRDQMPENAGRAKREKLQRERSINWTQIWTLSGTNARIWRFKKETPALS